MIAATTITSRPWHLWVIFIVATLFMSIGLYDFAMVASHNTTYLADRYTDEGVDYFTNYPFPLLILFGINVICAALAPLTGLFNSHRAMWLALISGAADTLLLIITIFFRDRLAAIGIGLTIQDIVICAGIFGLAGYFGWLNRKQQKISSKSRTGFRDTELQN